MEFCICMGLYYLHILSEGPMSSGRLRFTICYCPSTSSSRVICSDTCVFTKYIAALKANPC